MSEEIDRIIIKVLKMQNDMSVSYQMAALRLRDELKAAGYRIELDPDFLLQKGRDAGVVLND